MAESAAMLPSHIPEAELARRFHRLGALLEAHAGLWRPAPFHVPRPAWREAHPGYAAHLLALTDEEAAALAGDNRALVDLAGRFIPALLELHGLIDLPALEAPAEAPAESAARHVPGRKLAQIGAFAAGVGSVEHPMLEWCAGKGHLGRHLARRWKLPVTSLEWDGELCAEGERLAGGADQAFVRADALAPASARLIAGRHALALHACGDLHLALLRGVVERGAPALDLVPCCYYRIATPDYRPLNPDANLRLTRDELHLAVTETITAGARDRRARDRAQAWKLAFLEWRAGQGVPREKTFKPVPSGWMSEDFPAWMAKLAGREGLDPADDEDWPAREAEGWRRLAVVRRLELARLAFRRPLEIWLVLDRALFLARRGYRVRLAEFCDRDTTPRNVLISARLPGGTIMVAPTEPGP
jgi:hypothetical protein